LTEIGKEKTWSEIQKRYQSKGAHNYRGGKCSCNRHGHSNDLPSYFAFGHELLASFVDIASPDTWTKYQSDHPYCCGVAGAVRDPDGVKQMVKRLAAKRDKRAVCKNDAAQVAIAIDEKKARRAAARAKPKFSPAARNPQLQRSTPDSDDDDDDGASSDHS